MSLSLTAPKPNLIFFSVPWESLHRIVYFHYHGMLNPIDSRESTFTATLLFLRQLSFQCCLLQTRSACLCPDSASLFSVSLYGQFGNITSYKCSCCPLIYKIMPLFSSVKTFFFLSQHHFLIALVI